MGLKSGGVAQPFSAEASLKRALRNHLKTLGFTKDANGDLVLPEGGKEIVRNLHRSQRRERLAAAQPFLARALPRLLGNFANGDEIDPEKIQLSLIPIKSDTAEADLFRIATLTWSVPVSPGFGRRMRYLVWDEGHDRFAGVIALGDPVYNLSVRDKKIEWTVHDRSERLVGILDAYVLGAVPPYSMLLVGKATGNLSRADLKSWLQQNETNLRKAIDRWLPVELAGESREQLLSEFALDLLAAVDNAIYGTQPPPVPPVEDEEEDPSAVASGPPWEGAGSGPEAEGASEDAVSDSDPQPDNDAIVDAAADNLLDRLLYWGVLPRYAFPTDVAPFYVFSPKSTGYKAEMEFAPSQGLNVALSQYAPNKQIWINKKQYTSKAIYSPYKDDRKNAWGRRRMYYECRKCGHAKTVKDYDPDKRGERLTCEACQSPDTFGPAKPWFRPPGFAHLWGVAAPSVPDEPNETAYATRAKLIMPSGGPDAGLAVNPRIRALQTRQHLLVSNSGPDSEGYTYCTRCGRIESVSAPDDNLRLPHAVPYPNDGDPPCTGEFATRSGVVLGADFPTDIALFSMKLDRVFRLAPAHSETLTAMRTLCDALAMAACRLLQIESGEILAEYRPALNESGAAGTLVEVFLYDTLAGGAGFSPQMVPRATELFQTALKILDDCPEQCDASCYRCLRSFRNKLDHSLLDRFVGSQLLRHLIDGTSPPFSKLRASKSLGVLANELERQFGQQYEVIRAFKEGAKAKAPILMRSRADSSETLVDIHSPIAPSIPIYGTTDPSVVLVDDLRVRRHLGEEVEKVASQLK